MGGSSPWLPLEGGVGPDCAKVKLPVHAVAPPYFYLYLFVRSLEIAASEYLAHRNHKFQGDPFEASPSSQYLEQKMRTTNSRAAHGPRLS